jgi:hypothetical protein
MLTPTLPSKLLWKPADLPPTITQLVPPANGVQYHYDPILTSAGFPAGREIDPEGKWTVYIAPLAHAKLMAWDQGRHGLELSGKAVLAEHPQADPREDKTFYVTDIKLLCAIEESSGGYTEIPGEKLMQFAMWMMKQGTPLPHQAWWH